MVGATSPNTADVGGRAGRWPLYTVHDNAPLSTREQRIMARKKRTTTRPRRSTTRRRAGRSRQAAAYDHPTAEALLRPDVGTQAQFRKKKPPVTYRYDSSLGSGLNGHGRSPTPNGQRGDRVPAVRDFAGDEP